MQMTPHDVSLAWCRADVPWQLAHSDTQSCDTVVQCIPLINIDSQCTFQVLHIASATDRARRQPAFLAFLAFLELGCARHQVSVRMAGKVPGFRSH